MAQQVGDAGDLGQPRRGGAHLGRCAGDVNEQHLPSLARASDIFGRVLSTAASAHRHCTYVTRAGVTRNGYVTANDTVCQPEAPSGTGSAATDVWTAPVLSVARTVMVCDPGWLACQSKLHSRHVSLE